MVHGTMSPGSASATSAVVEPHSRVTLLSFSNSVVILPRTALFSVWGTPMNDRRPSGVMTARPPRRKDPPEDQAKIPQGLIQAGKVK